MSIDIGAVHDPDHYEEMQNAHETRDSAASCMNAFIADVRAARDKHGIADVLIVAEAPVVNMPKENVLAVLFCGNELHSGLLAAQALGMARAKIMTNLDRYQSNVEALQSVLQTLEEAASGETRSAAPSDGNESEPC